ncbi:hypothetical protein [Streptomyces flaveolus]|uniref:hypothetical protein n=1 Tax=Streptomyces flaveolus TaxID=67297 RepID=UPI0036FB3B01
MLRHQYQHGAAQRLMFSVTDALEASGLRTDATAAACAQMLCTLACTAARAGQRTEALAMAEEARRLPQAPPRGQLFGIIPAAVDLYTVGGHWALGAAGTALDTGRTFQLALPVSLGPPLARARRISCSGPTSRRPSPAFAENHATFPFMCVHRMKGRRRRLGMRAAAKRRSNVALDRRLTRPAILLIVDCPPPLSARTPEGTTCSLKEVLASTDRATGRTQDPQDGANQNEDATDRRQQAHADKQADNQQNKPKNNHLKTHLSFRLKRVCV